MDQDTRIRTEVSLQLLASIYRSEGLIFPILQLTRPEHFPVAQHREAWEAMTAAVSEGEGINPTSLVRRRVDPELLSLLERTAGANGETEILRVARVLAETYLQQSIPTELRLIASRAQGADPADTLDALRMVIASADATFAAGNHPTLSSHLEGYASHIEENARGSSPAISTGLPSLDDAMGGGFARTDFAVIGGDPGTGKTTLGLNMAHTQLGLGWHIGLIEAEMTRDEVFVVLNAIHAGMPADVVRSGASYQEVNYPFTAWMSKQRFDFVEVHDRQRTPSALQGMIERLARRGCEIIYVDYMQCFRVRGSAKISEYESVSHLASLLRSLSLRLKVCIIAIASNNRDAAGRSGAPTLNSYRGSGEAEYNATRAIQLHRTSKDTDEIGGDRSLDLLLLKNRSGRTGIIGLEFHLRVQRIIEKRSAYEPQLPLYSHSHESDEPRF